MNHQNWIDYINAGSGIATVLTLFYILYKEWKTREDVYDLKILAIEMEKQNKELVVQNELQRLAMKTEVAPEFVTEGGGTSGGTKGYIKIVNKGHKAIIAGFEDVNEADSEVIFQKIESGTVVKTDESLMIPFQPKSNKLLSECKWAIHIPYIDIYRNKYMLVWGGSGTNYTHFLVVEQ